MSRPNEPWDRNTSLELLPPEGHVDLGRQVFLILKEVLKDKKTLGLPDKWQRFYELSRNKHWRISDPSLNLVSANLLHAHRQRTVNLLTDNNPTFNVKRVTVTDDDEDKFDKLLRTSEFWWGETEQQSHLENSVANAELYGCCVEKSIFNTELEFGLGEVETVNVDVHHFGVYPVKCNDVQKAEACLHFYPMNIRTAKRRWPDHADKITADGETFNDMGEDRRAVNAAETTGGSGGGGSSTNYGGTLTSLMNSIGSAFDKKDDEIIVCECWAKDYTKEKYEEKELMDPNDPMGPYRMVEYERPKYKGHIRAVTVLNGRVVVDDKSNPSINHNLPEELARQTYLYDKFPFTLTPSITDTVNIWGMSDFEQLMWLQKEINKSISQFTSIKDKVAGMKIINPLTSGVHNNQLGNGVGVINPSSMQHGIEYLKPPGIPSEILDSLKTFQEMFYMVSGSFDLENAQSPGKQVIAYKAIAALIERAATMLRGKIRNYGRMIRERGRMYTSHVQNWYTEERYISYESDGEEFSDTVRGEDVIVPMRLTVVSGSTMPKSQVQLREEAIDLYAKGAIDSEELLKRVDWPDYKQVVARMNAGPIQEAAQRWELAGVPPEITEFMTNIASMEDKKLVRAIERSEINTFDDMFEITGLNDMDPDKELERGKKQSEIEEINARVRKYDADIKKINAEIVDMRDQKKIEEKRIRLEKIKIAKENIMRKKQEKEKANASV